MLQKKTAEKGGGTDFSWLNAFQLGGVERKIDAGEYVDGAELSSALRKHGQQPISPEVLDYLCRYLEGQIEKPRGRKLLPGAEIRRNHMIIRGYYRIYLDRLTDHKRCLGRSAGWTKLGWTPAEMAARIVAKRFMYGAKSWRRVQNIASSHK